MDLKSTAYKPVVRPQLEYASTVWSSHTASDINKLESVQRGPPSDYRYTSSVTTMLKDLNWRPLDQRRIDSRLVLMYKVTYDLVAIPASDYLFHNTRQSRHNRPLAYRLIPTLKDYYKYTFFANHYSLECSTGQYTSLTHLGTVHHGCLSGGSLIPLNTSILFLSFDYTNTLYRTVQTHFTYHPLLLFVGVSIWLGLSSIVY